MKEIILTPEENVIAEALNVYINNVDIPDLPAQKEAKELLSLTVAKSKSAARAVTNALRLADLDPHTVSTSIDELVVCIKSMKDILELSNNSIDLLSIVWEQALLNLFSDAFGVN